MWHTGATLLASDKTDDLYLCRMKVYQYEYCTPIVQEEYGVKRERNQNFPSLIRFQKVSMQFWHILREKNRRAVLSSRIRVGQTCSCWYFSVSSITLELTPHEHCDMNNVESFRNNSVYPVWCPFGSELRCMPHGGRVRGLFSL